MLDEAALLVLHRNNHVGQARDVVAAACSGQTCLRIVGVADEGRVQIAVLIDLRAAHESDVDIAPLQQQQHFGAAQHHVGALGAALVIGGWGQLARLNEGADHTALE